MFPLGWFASKVVVLVQGPFKKSGPTAYTKKLGNLYVPKYFILKLEVSDGNIVNFFISVMYFLYRHTIKTTKVKQTSFSRVCS